MSPELVSKIAIWRQQAAAGTLTQDQMKEAITALRADRVGAQVASDASRRKKAKTEIPSADDLLNELDGL
jgi:hypothetical protein